MPTSRPSGGTPINSGPYWRVRSCSRLGAGFGLVLPSVDAAISRIAPTEYLAGALSIRNATTFLGRTIGPITFTGAAVATGYRTLFFACGVGALAIGAVAVVVTDRAPSIDEESVTH